MATVFLSKETRDRYLKHMFLSGSKYRMFLAGNIMLCAACILWAHNAEKYASRPSCISSKSEFDKPSTLSDYYSLPANTKTTSVM